MTTIEKIAALKPNRILDVLPADVFSHDAGEPEGKHFTLHDGNCYEWYWALGRYYKPRSVLEIGVRYGYSVVSICAGAGKQVRLVILMDNEEYVAGSLDVALSNVKTTEVCYYVYANRVNSQSVCRLPAGVHHENMGGVPVGVQSFFPLQSEGGQFFGYEMVSIDGDHSYAGTLHDLNLTLNVSRVVVVDDYHFLGDVRRAVDHFVAEHSDVIAERFVIPSFRGTAVIEYKQ